MSFPQKNLEYLLSSRFQCIRKHQRWCFWTVSTTRFSILRKSWSSEVNDVVQTNHWYQFRRSLKSTDSNHWHTHVINFENFMSREIFLSYQKYVFFFFLFFCFLYSSNTTLTDFYDFFCTSSYSFFLKLKNRSFFKFSDTYSIRVQYRTKYKIHRSDRTIEKSWDRHVEVSVRS